MNSQQLAPQLSVIVPLYNEAESVRRLCNATREALDPSGIDYELLLVDDGSSDETLQIATELSHHDPRITLIALARNFGQTAAMSAGIEYARGQILVTMDGDLQNDPRDILVLVGKLEEGFDLVAGWRINRQDKLITRKIPSKIANWLIGKVTGIRIRDNGCSLKAYRAETIKRVPLYSDMHRFIPAMISTAGARIVEVPVRHHARKFGESKYGLSRTYKVLLDLIAIRVLVGYTSRPLIWFSKMALVPTFILIFISAIWILGNIGVGAMPTLSVLGSIVILLQAILYLLSLGVLSELLKQVTAGESDIPAAPQPLRTPTSQ